MELQFNGTREETRKCSNLATAPVLTDGVRKVAATIRAPKVQIWQQAKPDESLRQKDPAPARNSGKSQSIRDTDGVKLDGRELMSRE